MQKYLLVLILALIFSASNFTFAQTIDTLSLDNTNDSLSIAQIEKLNDTIKPVKKQKNNSSIDEIVNYQAADSIIFSFKENLIFMYKDSKVEYTDIVLEAGYSEVNLTDNTIKATYVNDTLIKKKGKPYFVQGDEKFSADTIKYNFISKKGLIKGIFTEQEGGFLHAEVTKKQPDNSIHLLHGKYTTCDLEHPHYAFKMTKAKVTEKKIISGPVFFTVADIPTPIGLPFAYFPKQSAHHSGILMPTYGEERGSSRSRGFFLKNGGYYVNLSDYWDLAIVGDIYSNGSWAVRTKSQYKKRYKYNGNFELTYSNDKSGEKDIDYTESTSYWIKWSHRQDAKANPTATFSASVNLGSSNYNTYNTQSMTDYLSSSFRSSIAYSKRWADSPFNFNTNISHSQNTQTNAVSIVMPDMALSMSRIFPFERKNGDGKQRWYEKISFSYNARAKASSNAGDSVMFTKDMPIDAGFTHSAPISASYKFLKFFTFSPKVDYNGVLYPNSIEKKYMVSASGEPDSLIIDTTNQVRYAHSFGSSVSLGFTAPIFGMYASKRKNSKIQALRHVITPSVSVSYTPDMGFVTDAYYKTYDDKYSTEREYSIFEGSVYGAPRDYSRESGNISMSLNNKLEMKLLNTADTTEKTKKVKILDRLDMRTGYNILADSLNWSPVSMSAGTKLFDKININTSARFNIYDVDSLGRTMNRFLFESDKNKFLQFKTFSFSTGYAIDSKTFGGDDSDDDNKGGGDYFGDVYYADFSVPWNLRFDYSLNIGMSFNKSPEVQEYEMKVTQTLRLSGGFSLTPLWKVSFTSGYDFKNREVTYTTLNLRRDLHCWEMSMSAVPFGPRKMYNFRINIKSSMFQDLKLEKKKSHLDVF